VLPWGEDDCIAWHTPFPEHQTQRPVAWSAGELDPATCEHVDERIWTAGCPGPFDGGGDGGPVFVHRLDGETGTVVDTLQVDGMPCTGTGPYGGAVDGDGNFWVFVRGEFSIARIDPDNADYVLFDIPSNLWGYGLAVDHNGRPWLSGWQTNPMTDVGGGRLDPATGTWDLLDEYDFSSLGGLQEGPDGRMWIATMPFGAPSPSGAVWVDADTAVIGEQITIPVAPNDDPKGISLDGEGNLWVVTLYNAFKIDPADGTVLGSTPLPFSYTYSDMTGWGLSNATCPPAG
jgi:streptogramin lyase